MATGQVDKSVALALKALKAGTANDGQQKMALEFILFEACRLREPSFVPDPYQTAFNEGRRYAGLLIAGAVEAQPAREARGKRNDRGSTGTG